MTSFGEDVAARYDDSLRGDEDETVACLAELAGNGPALELAVGTGRIALPLAARGLRVDGVEQCAAMIERLRVKPGGEHLLVQHGDMSTTVLSGKYPLVYLIFNLLTQDDQVRCFDDAAHHLTTDGRFLVEAGVGGPAYNLSRQYVDAEAVEVDRVTLDIGRYDPVSQLLDESHVELSAQGIRLAPIVSRFAWPSELDLMARLAGLRLHHRWGGWNHEPFTASSTRHVSVYGH